MAHSAPRFQSVILDVDSTLCGIEGIDWLAAQRGEQMLARIRALTTRATAGELALEEVYAARLAAVRPTRGEIDQLAHEYLASIAPDASACVTALERAGVHVEVVSGGSLPPVRIVAVALGIRPARVHAVDIYHDSHGSYTGYDDRSPLARQSGKPELVRQLSLPAPILAVGDGSTDLAMKTEGAVAGFAAFTGFARRETVIRNADYVVASFAEVSALVLGSNGRP